MKNLLQHTLSLGAAALVLSTALTASAAMKLPASMKGPQIQDLFEVQETYDCADPMLDLDLNDVPPEVAEALNNYYPCEGATWDWGDVWDELGGYYDDFEDFMEIMGMGVACTGLAATTIAVCGGEVMLCVSGLLTGSTAPTQSCTEDAYGESMCQNAGETPVWVFCALEAGAMIEDWDPCINLATYFVDTCLADDE